MDSESWTLIRWGALTALIGGVLFVLSAVLTNFFLEPGVMRYAADVPAYAALTLGLMGAYAAQSGRLGLVGEAGFCLALAGFVVGTLSGLSIVVIAWTSGPEALPAWLGSTANLGVLFVILGSPLFAIAILRAKILPRVGAWLLIAGPLLLLVMFFLGVRDVRLFTLPSALYGVGWAWLGYELPVAARRRRRSGVGTVPRRRSRS
jgi:hypothetical protein